ncbi:MAG: hypothetical protein B6I24_05495 [Bacteroidetes bacterium 4572_128]|nr:MAG: hypothetical protein B6I24_05495 [Bacteroidetes bacterium 4572_128]
MKFKNVKNFAEFEKKILPNLKFKNVKNFAEFEKKSFYLQYLCFTAFRILKIFFKSFIFKTSKDSDS